MPGILTVSLFISLNCQRLFKQSMPVVDLVNSNTMPVSASVEGKNSLELSLCLCFINQFYVFCASQSFHSRELLNFFNCNDANLNGKLRSRRET